MKLVKYFKALSDDTRLRMLNLLIGHELSVNEIVSVMRMGQSRISRHLKILTENSILTYRRDGLSVFYRAYSDNSSDANRMIFELLRSDEHFKKDLSELENILEMRSEERVRYFDSIANDWGSIKKTLLGSLNLSEEIAGVVPSCEVAADLGCGTGDLIESLVSKAEKVIGIDKSPRMLEEARLRFADMNGRVDLRIGGIEHLPMRDSEADAAVINMVLHYLPEPYNAIAESARVLKMGGTLVIADFDKHDNEEMRTVYGHRRLGFSVDEMKSWLSKAGYFFKKSQSYDVENGLKINLFVSLKNR